MAAAPTPSQRPVAMPVANGLGVPFITRIVSIDYYMTHPIPHIDYCFSSLEGTTVDAVPVIRIFGSTPAGQRACVHVHRVRWAGMRNSYQSGTRVAMTNGAVSGSPARCGTWTPACTRSAF